MFYNPKNPWVQLITDEQYEDSAVALREYLQFVDNSESPREFHLWSFLSLVSASLKRKCWASLGAVGTILPNQYVILVGPPAARKSTAIGITEQFHWASHLKLGPVDTAGQRYGLMMAFLPVSREVNPKRLQGLMTMPKNLDELSQLDTKTIEEHIPRVKANSDLYLQAKELSRLLTSQDRGMIDFLTDVWDGEKIDYKTKQGTIFIEKPSLNLLGATTPTSLAACMPRGASDHGILSRIIFVYASDNYRTLARPSPMSDKINDIRVRILERLKRISEYEGLFQEDSDAEDLFDSLYTYKPEILDSRFHGYAGRRSTAHLRKLGLAIAAARADDSQRIKRSDVALAHAILTKTEESMSQALLALGGSQLHLGKYLMIEFLRANGTASLDDLYGVAAPELKRTDAKSAIEELLQGGIIKEIDHNIIVLAEVIRQRKPPSSSQRVEPKTRTQGNA